MKRGVVQHLKEELNRITWEDNRDIFFWKEFYKFILISYKTKVDKRFSLSELAKYLKLKEVNNIQEILQVYFHTMSILAVVEGKNLYGEKGFYI